MHAYTYAAGTAPWRAGVTLFDCTSLLAECSVTTLGITSQARPASPQFASVKSKTWVDPSRSPFNCAVRVGYSAANACRSPYRVVR